MPGGFVARVAVEAGFLILLGIGAGLADLRSVVIVVLLGGGWLLVSLIELVAWRSQARPIAVYVPPPPEPEPEPGPEAEPDAPAPEEAADEIEEVGYPLRADAGTSPSEEVEEYTRILGASPEDDPPRESAE